MMDESKQTARRKKEDSLAEVEDPTTGFEVLHLSFVFQPSVL